MRRGQGLVEFSLVLLMLLMIVVGGWALNDAQYRLARIHFAAGAAARAAAVAPSNLDAAALATARELLAPTFPPDAVGLAFQGNAAQCPAYGTAFSLTLTVHWCFAQIPGFGPLEVDLSATRKGFCETT